jgi:hypothetical protein
VDALLLGLALSPPPGEDAHVRAELLHDLLEDKRVRAFTGSDGRRVAHATAEALESLGPSFALLVPPELLAEARAARLPPPTPQEEGSVSDSSSTELSPSRSARQIIGGVMVSIPALLGGGVFSLLAILPHGNPSLLAVVFCWIGGSLTAAVLAPEPSVVRTRWLHWLLLLIAAVPGVPVVAVGLYFMDILKNQEGLLRLLVTIPLGLGGVQLVGAMLLYGSPPPEPAASEE